MKIEHNVHNDDLNNRFLCPQKESFSIFKLFFINRGPYFHKICHHLLIWRPISSGINIIHYS